LSAVLGGGELVHLDKMRRMQARQQYRTASPKTLLMGDLDLAMDCQQQLPTMLHSSSRLAAMQAL
jgi:hypothetical protein